MNQRLLHLAKTILFVFPGKKITLSLYKHPRKIIFSFQLSAIRRRQEKAILSLQQKKHVTVAFFVLDLAGWKNDYLYKMMEQSKVFDPIIFVCPVVNFDRSYMLNKISDIYAYFKENGYNVIKSYDEKTDTYVDVRKEINPDIIFYQTPYYGQIDNRYFISEFTDKLTCYVPYFFDTSNNFSFFYNHPFHNFLWRHFVPTQHHLKYSQLYSWCRGENAMVTGYPGVDFYLDSQFKAKDVWKIKDRRIKRIIWAPHHTMASYEPIHYSCFLLYYQTMLDLAHKYSDRIQIAFKPHPLLQPKLYELWGKEKTDKYYAAWDALPNGFFMNGLYSDLFLTSDAIIHDCGSFIAEYLYTGKPAMRTDNPKQVLNEFSDFGLACLECYYHAKNADDIENFIVDVVLNGNDTMKDKRNEFYETVLKSPSGKMASQYILDYLSDTLRLE
jgi:hypothetical protein